MAATMARTTQVMTSRRTYRGRLDSVSMICLGMALWLLNGMLRGMVQFGRGGLGQQLTHGHEPIPGRLEPRHDLGSIWMVASRPLWSSTISGAVA